MLAGCVNPSEINSQADIPVGSPTSEVAPSPTVAISPNSGSNTADTPAHALKIPTAPKMPVSDYWQNEPAKNVTLYYYTSDGDNHLTFDENGNIITTPRNSTLIDISTGKDLYIKKTKNVDLKKDPDYNFYDYNILTAIFSLDGECIVDYSDFSYGSGFGDYVVRIYTQALTPFAGGTLAEDADCKLINIKTGEIVADDVFDVFAINEEKTKFLAKAGDGKITGIIDINGNKIVGFPMDNTYYYQGHTSDVIVAKNVLYGEGYATDYLLDTNLNVIKTYPPNYFISNLNDSNPKFLFANGVDETLILNKKGEQISSFAGKGEITYSSDDVLIVQSPDNASYQLIALNGTVLHTAAQINVDSLSGKFVALDGKNLRILDRSGKIEKTCTLDYSGNWLEYENETIIMGEYGENYWMLNKNLEYIVPPNKYIRIQKIFYGSSVHPVFQAYYKNPIAMQNIYGADTGNFSNRETLVDILDENGNVIFSGANRVVTYDYNRILLVQGFKLKIIDFCGNVIAEHSLFDEII